VCDTEKKQPWCMVQYLKCGEWTVFTCFTSIYCRS